MKNTVKIFKIGGSNAITINTYIMKQLQLSAGDSVLVNFVKKVEVEDDDD